MRSGYTFSPSSTSRSCAVMKSHARKESGRITRSALEWLISRSCQSATFSSPTCALARRIRARPQMRSQFTGFLLCGIEEEPFCPSRNGSSASRTSVRCKCRISSATFSSEAPRSAIVCKSSAWRSRCTTCVAAGSGSRPSDVSTSSSSSGLRCACVPTAPESFPTATDARARFSRSIERPSSSYQTNTFRPNVIGSACTPCVRPTMMVSLCRSASERAVSRRRFASAARRSQARVSVSASAVSTRSDEVIPLWRWRASSPTDSPTAVRNAITSWRTVASSSSTRLGSTFALARIRAVAPAGTSPRRSIAAQTASSTSSQVRYRAASSKRAAISGRL